MIENAWDYTRNYSGPAVAHKTLMATSTSMARRLQDWLIAASGLGVVVSGMAAIDETTRGYVFNALRGDLPTIPTAYRFHTIAAHVAEVFPITDSSFVAFGVVAFVLVVIMFRM
jgi:hypothetical protein